MQCLSALLRSKCDAQMSVFESLIHFIYNGFWYNQIPVYSVNKYHGGIEIILEHKFWGIKAKKKRKKSHLDDIAYSVSNSSHFFGSGRPIREDLVQQKSKFY